MGIALPAALLDRDGDDRHGPGRSAYDRE